MPVRDIATFTVSRIEVLGEDGTVDASLEPPLSEERLHALYRAMVLARRADDRMLKLQRQGRLGTFPPNTGQEAAACGAALAMGPRDWLVPTYREVGARLMRGERLEDLLLYYAGYEEGSVYAAERRVFPTQVILGSQLPHAVGVAYAMRRLGEPDTAVLTFCGDGASSEGDFHEALNFAAVWKAPVVFVVQNNGFAISHRREAQTAAETLAQKAVAYGMPGVQVDGNDALAVYRAAREAFDRARAGEGPSLIEAVTYRLLMHTTADDPKKYRDEAEEAAWWKRDPIPRFRTYLEGKGLWTEAQEASLVDEVDGEIEAAVRVLESPREVSPDAPFDHVFGTRHAIVEAQRAAFLRENGRG